MRKIYTYLAVFLLSFLGIQDLSAQSCGIIMNGNTYTTSVASGRDVINITITQGENITMTNSSTSTGTTFFWNAGQTTGPTPHLMMPNVSATPSSVVSLPTGTLTPCSYAITVNMGSSGPLACNNTSTVPGLLINLTVQSRINANGVAIAAGGVTFGTASCILLSTTNSTATGYSWDFGGTTATTQAMSEMNLPISVYSGAVTITNPGSCGVEDRTFDVSVQQSSIVRTGGPFSGTTATPSSQSITVTQGSEITMTNSSLPAGTTYYRWYAGTTDGTAHNLLSGATTVTPGSVISISTAGLTPCAHTITVTMVADGQIDCDEGHMQHLVLNALVRPRINFNGNELIDSVSIAQGVTTNLSTPTTAATYAWSFNSTTSSTSALPPFTLGAGLYPGFVTMTHPSCASVTQTVQSFAVRIQDACGVAFGNNSISYFGTTGTPAAVSITVNRGDTLRFTELGNSTDYAWLSSISSGSISVIGTNTSAAYELSTANLEPCTYTLTVTLGSTNGSCVSPFQSRLIVTLTVQSRLTLNGSPLGTSASLCQTVPIDLAASAATTYNWSFASSTSSTSALPTITGLTSGVAYPGSVTMTHPTCPVEIRNFTINIQDDVEVQVNGQAVANNIATVCQGTNISLSTATPAITYLWNLSGTTSTASTLNVSGLTPGAYSANVTLTTTPSACFAGTSTQRSFTVNVEANPTGILFASTNPSAPITAGNVVRLCSGNSTTIVASCPGGTCPVNSSGYRWGTASTTFPQGEMITITAPTTGATTTITYTLTVTNTPLCTATRTLTLVREFLPSVTVGSFEGSVAVSSVCSDVAINLQTINVGCAQCDNTGLSYVWSVSSSTPSINPSLQNNGFPTVNAVPSNTSTATGTASYLVSVTNAAGCISTATRNVSILPIWRGTINVNPATDICHGSVITVTATSATGYTFTNVDYDLYDYTINGYRGSIIGSSAAVNVITLTANIAHTEYDFELEVWHNNGCLVSIAGPGVQQVWGNPVITLSAPSTSCSGVPFTASVTPPSTYNYTWAGGSPTANNNIRSYAFVSTSDVSVTASYNPVPEITCRTTESSTVNVSSNAAITVTSPAPICNGASADIVVSYVTPPTTFLWSDGLTTTLITGLSGATFTVAPTVTTSYSVTTTNASGCPSIGQAQVVVNYPPSVSIVDPGTPLCPVSTLLNTVTTGGRSPYTYLWSGNAGAATTSTINVTPTGAVVSYSVTVTDANNCVRNVSRDIIASICGNLILTRNNNKTKYCENESIIFNAALSSSVIVANPSYQWSTGATTSSITLLPPLTNQNVNVIIADGAPKFKIDSVIVGTANITSTTASRAVFENNTVVYRNTSSATHLTTHPSLETNGSNDLYPKSILKFRLTPANGGTVVPTITDVVFDSYRGKIISQTGSATSVLLEVQIPCYKADVSNIAVTFVSSDNQVARTRPFLRIKSTNDGANSTDPDQVYAASGVLPASLALVHSTVTTALVSVEGTSMRPNVEYEIKAITTATELSAGTYTFTSVISGYDDGDNEVVTYRRTNGGGAILHTATMADGATTVNTSFVVTYPTDFPIDVRVKSNGCRGNALQNSGTSCTGAATHTVSITNPQFVNTTTVTISSTTPLPFGTTASDVSYIYTDPTPINQATLAGTVTGGGTNGSNHIAALTIPTSIPLIGTATVPAPFTTSASTIGIPNNGRTLAVPLTFTSAAVGAKTTAEGPSYVTDFTMSDFFRDIAVPTTLIPGPPTQTNILIPDRVLQQPAIVNGGSGGSVCLFEMSATNAEKDKVIISGTVFGNDNGVAPSVGFEASFNLSVSQPSIDAVFSNRDTICAGDQVKLTADTSPQYEFSAYQWSATPLMSAAENLRMLSTNSIFLVSAPTVTTSYSVTATDVYGCSADKSTLVYVNPLPGTTIGPLPDPYPNPRRYCPDGSITLFAQTSNIACAGNCSYNWAVERNNVWIPVGTSSTLARNFEENIRLSITANGCKDSATTTIAKYPLPSVAIAGSQLRPICGGTPITLTVDAATLTNCIGCNYQWNTGPTFSSLIVNSPGGYYVEATDANGCRALSQPVLAVASNTGSNLSVSGIPSTICQGQAAQLQVQPCLGCSYTWYRDDPTVIVMLQPDATSFPITANFSPSQRLYSTTVVGEYYAEIENQQGCVYRTTNSVEVSELNTTPPIVTSTTNVLCLNSSATLSTNIVHGSTYQWYKDGVILAAATSNTLNVTLAGIYAVSVGDVSGCMRGSADYVISASTFTPVLNPSNNTICNGDFVTLATTSTPGYTYQWYQNGIPISGAVASAYDATIAGNYYVRVTNNDGCVANTLTRTLNVSSISTPIASADKLSFCPNDSVNLSVSLCPGCVYQWFRNGIAIDASPTSFNYLRTINQAGTYTVRVSTPVTGCSQLSNAVVITTKNAALPSISATITEFCNGINPVLRTTACQDCNYTWIDAATQQPIFGALNDTIYTVTSQGSFRVQVAYPNGCVVMSAQQVVINGSFSTTITDNSGSQICNNSPITFTADLDALGLSRCTGGCSYQWFRNGVPLATTAINSYAPPMLQRLGGTYQVRVITPSGCTSESNLLPVTAITLTPNIVASAAAICGNTPVTLNVNNCPGGCNGAYTYLWSNGSTASTLITTASTSYIATVTLNSFCSATTPPLALNTLASLGTTIGINGVTVATASICAGDSVRMDLIAGCTACTYQWVRGTTAAFVNVPTATLNNYSTNVPNGYALIANDTTNNCRDTSNFVFLQQVNGYPGFALNFNGISLAASGGPVNLDLLGNGLTPAVPLHTIGSYSSTPLFAYNPPTFNPGLNNLVARRDTFRPATALPGNYLITYTYSDSGCVFTTSDVLPVQNAATVEIVNTNPLHVSYEACVVDTIRIETNNFAFAVNSILLFNQQDAYTTVAIASVLTNTDTLAADVIYHQQLTFVIPDWAKGCFVRLVGTRHGGAADSTTTQFLLIHNEPLALSGLPNTICSNGTPIVLTGTPIGGTFILQNYSSAAPNTAADTTAIAGAFAGTVLSPANIPLAQYDADGIDTMRVVYRFYSTFSNGNFCPQPDTAMQLVEARAVTLSQVRFNPISVSQTRERLDNLVKRVTPHAASPSRWLVGAPGNQHQIVYGGSFTTPAGAPEEFLPANAGVGSHTLTYTIRNGICANTVSDVIQVLPAPSPIAISDTICRNIAPVIFGRDPAMAYQANSLQFIQTGITFADTFNTLVVSSVDTSNYITVINPNVGLEQFSYQPVAPDTVLIRDTFLVQYIYSRVEYDNGLPFDTVTYVMASFYQPLFIEDTTLVNILDTLLSPVICENNQDVLVAATPSGGVFTLQGGTGAYAANSVLTNNILNSFAVHQNETANTNYILTYTLNGVACRSRDTFNFLIPEPLNPTFTTAGNIRTFCNSALPIPIVANTVGNFTNVLLVNGVAQPTMHFTPTLAIPGPQIVINEVTDTDFGCITSYRDSFHVFPLPLVRIDTFAVREFCTNDSVFQFTIHPAPTCIGATGGELLTQGFNGQVLPAGWNFSNLNPASSGWGQAIVGGLSVAFVDTTSISQNTWLYSAQIPMVAGGTYQVEYLMRVGPRNCASCADATMAVTVGGAANPAAQTTVLATYPTLDDNYAGFYTLQSHSFIAPTTGNFRFAFNATSQGRTTRWIAIDTVVVRQITAGNCLTGIGSISGAGIVNTPGNDSLYTFVPSSVAPGVYTMRYSFSDTRGCIDSVVVPIEVKPHPTVAMSALDPTYCWNALPVPMSGTPVGGVFNINRLSGAAGNNMTLGGLPINNVTYNTAVPLRFTPRHVGVERIEYRYRDPLTQCATSVFDTLEVLTIPDSARFLARVNAPTDPNALLDIYCQTNPAITLNVEPVRGTPQAGFFYGAGVLNGAGGPGVAQIHFDSAVVAMGRVGNDTLTYVYLASNGCQDTTRFVTRIEPIPTLSFDLAPTNVRLPDSICLNDPARGIQVRHQQWTGALGNTFIDTMIIFGAGTMNASALQIGDTINPVNFGEGWHNVSYYFRNVYGCENTIQDSFRVDTVPVIFFTGLPASRSYCENEQGGLLLAYPAYYPGSGYLQLGTRIIDSNFIYIDPAQLADPTQTVVYDIYYTFTNLRGCTADGTDSIEIRPFPRITFSLDSVYCNQDDTLDLFTGVTPIGGVFTDNLPVTSIIQNRYLNLNSDAGPRTLTYFYTDSTTLCSNTATQNVTLYHTPTVAFQAVGGCQGVDVIFEGTLSNLDASFDSLTQVIWTFGDGNSTALTPIDPILVPSTTHTYTTHGYMMPSLTVVNRGLCSTTVANNLTVSPTIVLNRYLPPYVEDFETSAGFWYPEQEQVTLPTDTVWSHRLLSNGHIVDSTNQAWVTYGNQAPFVYGAGHRAHIYSPCFDFTNTWRPMLSMDVWRDMNPGVDGAVLEYYEPTTRSWNVVGEINQGIRWYQSNFLLSRPGGQRNGTLQPTGWTGFSEGWDNVRYRLDQFAGKSSVRFRVAFAASSNTVLIDQPQGFAFDSVWIGERGRNVLVEHFTNFMTPDVYFVEQGLYDKIFNNMYGRDVTMIQYHIEVPSLDDQYNQANFVDPAARALDYGLDTCNRAVVDGSPRGDGTTLNLDIRELDLDMLQFPAFSIFIDPIVINGNDITVSSTILAMQDMPVGDYAIMTAILEDSLPNQIINQNSFIYPLMGVMRKLLPNNAGSNYNGSWWQGQQLTTSESYTMTTPIPSNPAMLHAAVFIQNRASKEVYQVATTRDLTIYAFDSLTNVVPGQPNQVADETSSLKLYPNPATNYFTVEFEQALQTEQTWQLVDVLGRVLQTGKAEIGTTNFQVNTENLSAAPYFFTIRNASVYTQRQVIITKP